MLSSVRQSLVTKSAFDILSKRCNNITSNVAVLTTQGVDVRRGFHTTLPRWKFGSYNVKHDEHSWYGTTIICVRKNGKVCMMGDGQVSQGSTMVKGNARKIRRIKSKGSPDATDGAPPSQGTIVGFAGTTADAFTLLDRLEEKLDEYPGQLDRACVELAKGWRLDKYLRRLDAAVLVANERQSFEVTGNGDVLESPTGILGIGSGSVYAIAAARALIDIPELSAEDVARKAMAIASDMCIYTNFEYTLDVMDTIGDQAKEEDVISNPDNTDATSQPTAEVVDETKEKDADDDDSSDEEVKDKKDGEEDDDTKK